MIHRLVVLVATAFLAVGLVAAPAAADGEIGLSYDGVNWTTSLSTPMFAPGFTWVPGDVEQRSFLVRNDGPSAGEVTVDVLAEDPNGLIGSPDFVLEARLGTGTWSRIVGGTTQLQPAALNIARGANTTVTVRGSFRSETTARMDQMAPFSVRVTMSEDGAVAGESSGGKGKGGKNGDGDVGGQEDVGGLPGTGNAVSASLLWLAAGLIGGGIALVRRRGTREEQTRG